MAPASAAAKSPELALGSLASALQRMPGLSMEPGIRAVYFNGDGSPKKVGERVTNPALAETLQSIAAEGARVLRDGPIAADAPMDEFEDCDDAEDMYDAVESAKAEEDCWTACARRDSPVEGHRAPTRTIEAPPHAMRKFTPKTAKDEDDF